jgi:hypothetical protein
MKCLHVLCSLRNKVFSGVAFVHVSCPYLHWYKLENTKTPPPRRNPPQSHLLKYQRRIIISLRLLLLVYEMLEHILQIFPARLGSSPREVCGLRVRIFHGRLDFHVLWGGEVLGGFLVLVAYG